MGRRASNAAARGAKLAIEVIVISLIFRIDMTAGLLAIVAAVIPLLSETVFTDSRR